MTARPRPHCPVNTCTLLSVAKDYKKLKMCRLFHMQDLSAFYLHLRSCKEKKNKSFVLLNAAGCAESFS